jgi:hypothetical protein
MLKLKPLGEPQGRSIVLECPITYFHCAYRFATRILAHMLDSLVRVSRRVGLFHLVSVNSGRLRRHPHQHAQGKQAFPNVRHRFYRSRAATGTSSQPKGSVGRSSPKSSPSQGFPRQLPHTDKHWSETPPTFESLARRRLPSRRVAHLSRWQSSPDTTGTKRFLFSEFRHF